MSADSREKDGASNRCDCSLFARSFAGDSIGRESTPLSSLRGLPLRALDVLKEVKTSRTNLERRREGTGAERERVGKRDFFFLSRALFVWKE